MHPQRLREGQRRGGMPAQSGGLLALPARIVRRSASPYRPMRRAVPLLILLACLLAPAVAGASPRGGKRVLDECANTGTIADPGRYTHNDYEWARSHIPSDLAEYTTCQDEIRRAEAAAESQRHGGALGGGGGSSGGPGGTPGYVAPPT